MDFAGGFFMFFHRSHPFKANRLVDNLFEADVDLETYEDELATWPNPVRGRKMLRTVMEKKIAFTLLAIRIRGISSVNMNLGFDIGDKAVQQMSRKLKDFVDGKGFLYRLHGNEWEAIILPAKKKKHVENTARQLIDKIQEPININGHTIFFEGYIGICPFNSKENLQLNTLLKHTYTALEEAKDAEEHYFFYSPKKHKETLKTYQLKTKLYQAIERNELFLEYQPVVDLKTLKVTGAEAVLQWDHPDLRNIPPSELIPIIEERNTTLEKLNHIVIDMVCQQIQAWKRKRIPDPKIILNVSAKAFSHDDLVHILTHSLKKYKIPAQYLELKILESEHFDKTETIKKQMEEWQKTGISLCIYGTGYSSIEKIKDWPINKVIIDRTLIKNIENNEEKRAIIQSMIENGRNSGVKICAEGIENGKQLSILWELNCDEAQGPYFCPHVSEERMARWFKSEHIPNHKEIYGYIKTWNNYFGIELPKALCTKITILSVDDRDVSAGSTEVAVTDLSPEGLCFISHLRFPVKENIIYGFTSELDHTPFEASGKIVFGAEVYPGIYKYRVNFAISEAKREQLIQLLFRLHPKLRDNPNYIEGNFTNLDPIIYIKQKFLGSSLLSP